MVRKISVFAICLTLIVAIAAPALADTHQVYDGSFSGTYVNYFKDTVSGLPFTDHYVAFRSSDNSYTMVSGNLKFENGVFTLNETGKIYVYSAVSSGYSSVYQYNVTDIDNFQLSADNHIIYSDLGDYPQLVSRGEKYEILSTFLICLLMLSFVIFNMLRSR